MPAVKECMNQSKEKRRRWWLLLPLAVIPFIVCGAAGTRVPEARPQVTQRQAEPAPAKRSDDLGAILIPANMGVAAPALPVTAAAVPAQPRANPLLPAQAVPAVDGRTPASPGEFRRPTKGLTTPIPPDSTPADPTGAPAAYEPGPRAPARTENHVPMVPPSALARPKFIRRVRHQPDESLKVAAPDSVIVSPDTTLGPLELEATTIDGERVSLAALRGKRVLLDFISAYCGPCLTELPVLDALVKSKRDVVVVAIARGELASDLRRVLTERGVTFPFLLIADPTSVLLPEIPSRGTPTHVVLDRAGRWSASSTVVGSDLIRLNAVLDAIQ